ncbi:putative cytochrome p450 [Rosellinia necatrix]|uniref:Putative cytochrome p450 n=1 Tax=Rosellinia necatrix TaxID=77044 RepID=A0A1W2TTU2_ROSNE|nr:putative cytochrome p450 [Rosellinia necatrix]
MHREYGPIVRINPNEVHFNDAEFINDIYPTTRRKTDKPSFVGWRSGTPDSIVATLRHDTHRLRRNSISAFFSDASVGRVEPNIKKRLTRMLERWDKLGRGGGVVLKMSTVFQAYASDIITSYAFGDCFNFLDDDDWGEEYFSSQDKYFKLTHIFGCFPFVIRIVNNMPSWIMGIFIPNLSAMLKKQEWRINRVRQIRVSPDPNAIKSTIFESILSSNLPDNEKTDTRMAHDAQLIILAGESTTGHTLCAILFELLSHPYIYKMVKDEISQTILGEDSIASYIDVQNLPYFNAVINEGLRLHPGVISRMPRISPEKDIIYQDKKCGKTYVVPAGIPAGMTTLIMHTDPELFEDPLEFRPQRWIDNPKLGQAMIAFSRGSRNCIGQGFARCEISIILATILRRYEIYSGQPGRTLELYETIRERDIVANSEMIIPVPAKGSHGLRVRVRS